jgi:hypothetical protein
MLSLPLFHSFALFSLVCFVVASFLTVPRRRGFMRLSLTLIRTATVSLVMLIAWIRNKENLTKRAFPLFSFFLHYPLRKKISTKMDEITEDRRKKKKKEEEYSFY